MSNRTPTYSLSEIQLKIDQEVSGVEALWTVFRQLFTTQDSVDILNACAPGFFQLVAWRFVDAIILGVCRLTDPAQQGSYKNLTFDLLRESLLPEPDSVLLADIDQKLKTVKKRTRVLRKHRDKRIAHIDRHRALGNVESLNPIERARIEVVLGCIREFLKAVNEATGRPEVAYEDPINAGNGQSVIQKLKEGMRWRKIYEAAHTPGRSAAEILQLARQPV
jgi:hypothetical protein